MNIDIGAQSDDEQTHFGVNLEEISGFSFRGEQFITLWSKWLLPEARFFFLFLPSSSKIMSVSAKQDSQKVVSVSVGRVVSLEELMLNDVMTYEQKKDLREYADLKRKYEVVAREHFELEG